VLPARTLPPPPVRAAKDSLTAASASPPRCAKLAGEAVRLIDELVVGDDQVH